MNNLQLAQQAYTTQSRPMRAPRTVEYEAFARVTAALKSATTSREATATDRIQALHDNRSLWSVVASSVADPENKLPEDLRARLFYLAEFCEAESRAALTGSAGLDALIDVNSAIMKGLSGHKGDAE